MPHERLARVSRHAVERAASHVPEATRPGWLCRVGDREVRVKELVKAAANQALSEAPPVSTSDFQTAGAVRILRNLGFEVTRQGRA